MLESLDTLRHRNHRFPPYRGPSSRSTLSDAGACECVLSLEGHGVALRRAQRAKRLALDSHSGRALAEAMSPLLTDSEVSQQLAGLANWRRAQGDDPAIAATYEFTDFVAALDFVNQVGHEAELMNNHPALDIRWNT